MKTLPRTLAMGMAALAALAVGAGAVAKPQVAFLASISVIGVACLAAPASAWVIAAVIAAMTFKGLASLGVLPDVASFIDIPLAWGALLVALLKHKPHSPFVIKYLRWFSALGLAVAIAWAFNPSEPQRPLLYLALLGEPFAIIGALIVDPPSPRMRLALERTLLALVLVQIPFAALELVKLGPADNVKGTLYGASGGAHVVSAVIVVGAFWLLSGGIGRRTLGKWRYPTVVVLLIIPFVADAKQVIVALPAVLLVSSWRVGRKVFFMRAVVAIGAVVALFTLAPAGNQAANFVNQNANGKGGKQATALFIWHKLDGDPAAVVFGKGPAETVSRAAFMTTYLFQKSGSAVKSLGLKPAPIAIEAWGNAVRAENGNGNTSIDSAASSTLGVVGDLGIFGFLVYAGLALATVRELRRGRSPECVAAAAGFAMFLVLGVVFDWWEQPPFGVFLGALAGLGLSRRERDETLERGENARNGLRPEDRPAGPASRKLNKHRISERPSVTRRWRRHVSMAMGRNPGRARSFGYGLIAQTCSAATNFALVVIAGHVLGPSGLGTTFIGFAAYVVLLGFERALFTDPLLAITSARASPERRLHTNATVGLAGLAMLPLSALLVLIGLALPTRLGFGLLLFAPWIGAALLQDLGRSIVFRDRSGPSAALSDATWLVTMAALAPFAFTSQSEWVVVGCWGMGAAAGCAVALAQIGWRPTRFGLNWWKSALWPFGRWLAGQSVLYSTATYVTVLVLAGVLGARDYGGFRAVLAVFAPLTLLGPALALPGYPHVARAYSVGRRRALDAAAKLAGLITLVTASYAIVLYAFPQVLTFFFGATFVDFQSIIVPIGLGQVLAAPGFGLTLYLKSAQRGRTLLYLSTLSTFSYLVAAVGLALLFGLSGAAWGTVVAASVSGIALLVALYLTFRSLDREANVAVTERATVVDSTVR